MSFKGNYIYIILLAVIFFFSCQEKKQTDQEENKQEVLESKETVANASANFLAIVYRNVLNEITDINLTIKKEGTFIYYQAPLSKTPEGEYKTTTLSGTWTKNENWIVLKFEDQQVKATTIFTITTGQEGNFKVIDDTTVQIDSDQEDISILGIRCIKSII
ncbi:hypothetical protein GCM10011344_04370 [Dokdonia pacifica]|uniref:NlpE N-terminal domain-containing protein n=1 Tax=Dokdonia pacifica TaxID=1627892 RepID=A0A238ZLW5_9FLAO|nr:hypothetical protein [Dokdonia pacifica]GGG07012.1 hypothetical protein GCM10011344_04370 [Dokdonia pacifica]SNR83704.1 hypothetical protein SAMN06265376_103299 [Dokdonia pacifica]